MKSLSRNLPVTLVIGAAGFIGSHLTERLLEEGIQVVGVDDLSTGSLENLSEASRNNHFQFIKQSLTLPLNLENLPRLDYGVFCISENLPSHISLQAINNFINSLEGFSPKILFVSSIELYESRRTSPLKEVEGRMAKLAADNNLNARVVRLASIYGPRMHFREVDPMVKLIKAESSDNLQKEIPSLDFTTRALYISDAISLLKKSLFHGSTVHKIYDGTLLNPVKVQEAKQVLLDPLWYENTKFEPSLLPPWPTPNLEKTVKELNWKPTTSLVSGLKETVRYFKQNPGRVRENQSSEVSSQYPVDSSQTENRLDTKSAAILNTDISTKQPPKLDLTFITNPVKKHTPVVLGAAVIVYALLVPLADIAIGSYTFRSHILGTVEGINKGEFGMAKQHLSEAKQELAEVEEAHSSYILFKALKSAGLEFKLIDDLLAQERGVVQAATSASLGVEALALSWGSLSGSSDPSVLGVSNSSQAELSGLINSLGLLESMPKIPLLEKLGWGIGKGVANYSKLATLAKTTSSLISEISSTEGSYLVVLIDNKVARAGGGQTLSVGRVDIKSGKIEKVEVEEAATLDKKLTEIISPPTDVAKDLKVSNWSLKEALSEPNFPTSAQTVLRFYELQTGIKAQGLVVLDTGALEALSTSSNTGNLEEALNNWLYVPQKNLIGLAQTLEGQINQKGVRFYFSNPKLQTLVSSLNWEGSIKPDSLGWVESDISSSGISQIIKREAKIDTKLSKDGKVTTIIQVTFTNPGENKEYQTRFKLYAQRGQKLTGALINNQTILPEVGNFSDYDMAGYSILLNVLPKEQKTIKLELVKEGTGEKEFTHNLKLFKQAGILPYLLKVTSEYPAEFEVTRVGDGGVKEGRTIKWETNLDSDKQFETGFKRIR